MTRSSPKFSHEPINEFFYDWSMNGTSNEFLGDGDVGSVYERFNTPGGVDLGYIDEFNAERVDFEDQINAEEIVSLNQVVGAILKTTTDGFVSVETYTDVDALENAWIELRAELENNDDQDDDGDEDADDDVDDHPTPIETIVIGTVLG